MALDPYFVILGYEIGGSQQGTLQYYASDNTWADLGQWVANSTDIIIDGNTNPIAIPYREPLLDVDGETPLLDVNNQPLYNGIFFEGGTWMFRLIDEDGHPISNVITYTFPLDNPPLLNIDGLGGLLNVDDVPLLDV